jgi:hypothetical protein
MQETIEAIYENGVLKPLKPLPWLTQNARVLVTVSSITATHPVDDVLGPTDPETAPETTPLMPGENETSGPDRPSSV